jgi:hypothetical protein
MISNAVAEASNKAATPDEVHRQNQRRAGEETRYGARQKPRFLPGEQKAPQATFCREEVLLNVRTSPWCMPWVSARSMLGPGEP